MFAGKRGSVGDLEESAAATPTEASPKSAAEASSEAAAVVAVAHSIQRVTHVHRLRFLRVVARTVSSRDDRSLSCVGIAQIGQDLSDQVTTQHVEFWIGIVVAAFDQDRERLASHTSCDFQDFVLPIGSQRGCAPHEVVQVEDEVDSLAVGLHRLVVGPDRVTKWQGVRNRVRPAAHPPTQS